MQHCGEVIMDLDLAYETFDWDKLSFQRQLELSNVYGIKLEEQCHFNPHGVALTFPAVRNTFIVVKLLSGKVLLLQYYCTKVALSIRSSISDCITFSCITCNATYATFKSMLDPLEIFFDIVECMKCFLHWNLVSVMHVSILRTELEYSTLLVFFYLVRSFYNRIWHHYLLLFDF